MKGREMKGREMKSGKLDGGNDHLRRAGRGVVLACAGFIGAVPLQVDAQALECTPSLEAQVLGGPVFLLNEAVRVQIEIGAGAVSGFDPDNYLFIDSFGYILDCSAGDIYPNCTDAGNSVAYADNITNDCVDSAGDPVDFDATLAGDTIDFSAQSGLPLRFGPNETCTVEFDVVVNAIAEDNASATIVEVLGFLDTEARCGDGETTLSVTQTASVSFDITARRAQFRVTKDFSDDNPGPVDVSISCNTGLPLDQSQTISEFGGPGSFDSVTFVVDAFDAGELDCEVTEGSPPAGYASSYAADSLTGIAGTISADTEGCYYTQVTEGTFLCEITNTLQPVDIVVTKEWFGDLEAAGLGPEAGADWTCYNVRSAADDTSLGSEYGQLWFSGNPDTDSFGGLFPDYGGSSYCTVTERVLDAAVESDDSDCASLPISLGSGNSCTITNTVFFEGIPTLSHLGLAIMALLVLGVGLVGFRRFA